MHGRAAARLRRAKVVTRQQTRSRWQRRRLAGGAGITVTKALVAINVVVFLVELATGATRRNVRTQLVRLGALVPSYVLVKHEYWRMFTSMFLHAASSTSSSTCGRCG